MTNFEIHQARAREIEESVDKKIKEIVPEGMKFLIPDYFRESYRELLMCRMWREKPCRKECLYCKKNRVLSDFIVKDAFVDLATGKTPALDLPRPSDLDKEVSKLSDEEKCKKGE